MKSLQKTFTKQKSNLISKLFKTTRKQSPVHELRSYTSTQRTRLDIRKNSDRINDKRAKKRPIAKSILSKYQTQITKHTSKTLSINASQIHKQESSPQRPKLHTTH